MKYTPVLCLMACLSELVWACLCAVPPSPQEALQQAAAVFTAKVKKIEKKELGSLITLTVVKSWKRINQPEVQVSTGGHSCGIDFTKQTDWLVFASRPEHSENYLTDYCTTFPLQGAEDKLKQLGSPIWQSEAELLPSNKAEEFMNKALSGLKKRNLPEEKKQFELGCQKGKGDDCWLLGLRLAAEAKDFNVAIPYYKDACQKNSRMGCLQLKQLWQQYNQRESDWFKETCSKGSAEACQIVEHTKILDQLGEKNQILESGISIDAPTHSLSCLQTDPKVLPKGQTHGFEKLTLQIPLRIKQAGQYRLEVRYASDANGERQPSQKKELTLTQGSATVDFVFTFGQMWGLFVPKGQSELEISIDRYASYREIYGDKLIATAEQNNAKDFKSWSSGRLPAASVPKVISNPDQKVYRRVDSRNFTLSGFSNIYTGRMGKLACP